MINANKKVLLALSGGVDSSVAVHLLKQQGYYVEAVVLDFSPAHKATVEAAKQSADMLKIKLHIVNCHDEFKKNVITPFAKSYLLGKTPNPCIFCNPTTKFHFINAKACELGFDHIATGHYASVEHTNDNRHLLKKADCINRDQSYMLYRLNQEQLSKLILPLQNLPKDEVRKIAREINLPCADKPDSQEICFVPDNNYANYIEHNYGKSEEGDFISPDGNVCGKHKGILHYTIGQRKGLGIALGYPVFIKHIDSVTNKIYLAKKGEEYFNKVILEDCCILPVDILSKTMHLGVKIRSVAKEAMSTVNILEDNKIEIIFDEPQRAPAPGQSCVLYHNDYVVGGGYIKNNFI